MPTPDEVTREILRNARTIAVVGLSDKPDRDSNEVARYLERQGYEIVPVNPNLPEVLGHRSFPSVAAIPVDIHVDIVDLFRRSDQVAPSVAQAIAREVGTIWMQLGVRDEASAVAARARGIRVYQDVCIMQEHRRLGVGPKRRGGGIPVSQNS